MSGAMRQRCCAICAEQTWYGCSGGGAVEAALSIYLENFATTLGSREQLAIAEAADALLVIPKPRRQRRQGRHRAVCPRPLVGSLSMHVVP